MSLVVKQTGGDFEMVPEGQYVARCIKVIDLGTQTVTWAGEEKKQHKVQVVWEILDEDTKMKDGRPFAVSKMYTASLNEGSHLYKDLVGWRGRKFTQEELLGFDISKLLGAYTYMQVVHNEATNGKTYANVDSLMATKERPEGVNDTVYFDINNPDMEVFDGLSDYLKDKIRAAEEWEQDTPDESPVEVDEEEEKVNLDDIPF